MNQKIKGNKIYGYIRTYFTVRHQLLIKVSASYLTVYKSNLTYFYIAEYQGEK